ncbi:alpha/beta fold hydrolase [Paenibacillus lignilyticus]|uniref:Alpha/beta hydrolase n=1 Tax=Paenibacillus lignilyticus TaxID=1172615 RepID=A0ABS5C8F0_9BACL|nr:alpha/beta hydrolase [Paenibacillus lignilyticus]MBP3962267.1 alpha/beta hydrolase [Paenibacillus lignilyticus]
MPFLNIGDTALHYHQDGSGKPPILFVHPPCLTSRLFTTVQEKWTASSGLIRFDIRGHGYSEAGGGKLSLALIAEDMRRLLDGLGVKQAYVCSYGAGSFPALAAMLAYPERFVGGIMVSGASAYTDIVTRSKLQAAFISSILSPKGPIAFKAAWSEAGSKSSFEELHTEAKLGDSNKWREYTAACLDSSVQKRLPQLKQPVLILYGTADKTGQNYAAELKRRLPNSELYGIIGAGRQLLTKEPVTTAFVMTQWLAKQEHPEIADTYQEQEALLDELISKGIQEGAGNSASHH